MTRIGRQIPHFSEIEMSSIEAVFSENYRYRYVLSMRYQQSLLRSNNTNRVTVILKNPSSADVKQSDATIRKVETYVYRHFADAGLLTILNIFALRATDARDVQACYKQWGTDYIVGSDNDLYFRQVLKNTSHLICAWGGNSGIDKTIYTKRIAEVQRILTEFKHLSLYRVAGAQPTTEPLHGLMWGYHYRLENIQNSDMHKLW